MKNKNNIYKQQYELNKNVLIRYEQNISNGTLFVYDACEDKLWLGNHSSYLVLRLLRKKCSLQFILKNCREYFSEINNEVQEKAILELLNELITKGFIIKYE